MLNKEYLLSVNIDNNYTHNVTISSYIGDASYHVIGYAYNSYGDLNPKIINLKEQKNCIVDVILSDEWTNETQFRLKDNFMPIENIVLCRQDKHLILVANRDGTTVDTITALIRFNQQFFTKEDFGKEIKIWIADNILPSWA